jgi:hypothetical protein
MTPQEIEAEMDRLRGQLAGAQEAAIRSRHRDDAVAAEWAESILSDPYPDAKLEPVARAVRRLLDEKYPPTKDA